jgi:hypothetical protein
VLALEQRVDVQVHRHLDRLARRARGRDDDDASGRGSRSDERVMIEWKVRVADPSLLAAQRLCGGFAGAGAAVDFCGAVFWPPCGAGWRAAGGGGAAWVAGRGDVCTMNAGVAPVPKVAPGVGPPPMPAGRGSLLISGFASGAAVSCTERGAADAGADEDAFDGAGLPGVETLAAGLSPNTTCAFAGRFRTAVAQSVGAGCRSAGTPSIQMRHIPAGGLKPSGTLELPDALWAPAELAINALMVQTLTTNDCPVITAPLLFARPSGHDQAYPANSKKRHTRRRLHFPPCAPFWTAPIFLRISPGSACRPSFDFSKSARPSIDTSKRPPFDGTSSTTASGCFALISAARPAARGS